MSAKLLDIFVKSVKGLLHAQNLSQTDFSKKLGVSRQTVSQFITGEHAPRLDKVEDIALALKVPPFYLLMSEEERAIWDSKTAQKTDCEAIESLQDDVIQIKKALSELNIKADKCLGDIHKILTLLSTQYVVICTLSTRFLIQLVNGIRV